jgi:hypothetical protein
VAIVKVPLEQGPMRWEPKGGVGSCQSDDFSGFFREAGESREHPYLYHQRKEKRRKEKDLLVCTQSQIRITAVAMKPKRTASHRKSACSLCRSFWLSHANRWLMTT